MNRVLLFLVAALLVIPAIQANARPKSNVDEHPMLVKTLDGFQTDSERIRKEMEAGGKYDNISARDKARVEARLGDMLKLLQSGVAQSAMTQNDKIALANAQEEINGILSHNDNNRLVCRRVAPVGSHLPVTTCQTYAEVLAERRATQHQMTRDLKSINNAGGGKSN